MIAYAFFYYSFFNAFFKFVCFFIIPTIFDQTLYLLNKNTNIKHIFPPALWEQVEHPSHVTDAVILISGSWVWRRKSVTRSDETKCFAGTCGNKLEAEWRLWGQRVLCLSLHRSISQWDWIWDGASEAVCEINWIQWSTTSVWFGASALCVPVLMCENRVQQDLILHRSCIFFFLYWSNVATFPEKCL